MLYQLTTLVLTWLLPDGSFLGISFLMLLLAAYGSIRGIEGRARVYEIIFWFLGIPLLVMLFLASREVNTAHWTPMAFSEGTLLVRGSLAVVIFLLPLTGLLFLKPFCRKPEKIISCGRNAMAVVLVMNGVIYLILTGIFGQNTMGVLKRPIITLMSMINLPGGFLTRQDVLMTAVWFFALFALLNTGLFQGTQILKELCRESGNRWSMCVVAVLVFLLGKGLFEHSFLMEVYEIYQTRIALPGMFLILLVLLVLRWIKAGRKGQKGENV